MAAVPTEGRHGLKAFRLSDVPLDIRYRAQERLLKLTDSGTERTMLGIAALQPSDRIYWIPVEAWEAVANSFLWKRAQRKEAAC